MPRLTCSAACGNFEICLVACPHNAGLDPLDMPTCEPSVEKLVNESEKLVDEDEKWLIVIEDQGTSE